MQDKQSVLFTRLAERQQEARDKVVIQRLVPPPNYHIMAYAPKRVSFGIKAIMAFWGILKNKALTIWGLSEYEALGQSASLAIFAPPLVPPSCRFAFHKMLALKVFHCQHAQSWVFSLTVRPKTECCPTQKAKYFIYRQSSDSKFMGKKCTEI